MPLYEYRCDACEHEFEALQKVSDEPLLHCPDCEAPELKKLISTAGFRLKGQGWYETDFKTGSKKNLAENTSSNKSENKSCGTGCGCH